MEYKDPFILLTLQWRHNGRDNVSNHQPHDCLLNGLFRRRSKKISKLRVTGLCAGNHRGQVNSPHKWTVTRKTFPFDDVIMSQYHDAYWLSSPRTFWLQHQTISFLDNVLQFEICDIAAIVGIGIHGICLILQEWSSVSNGGVKEPVPKIYLKKFDIEFPNPRFSHPSWP